MLRQSSWAPVPSLPLGESLERRMEMRRFAPFEHSVGTDDPRDVELQLRRRRSPASLLEQPRYRAMNPR
jgi:hypothetical protein